MTRNDEIACDILLGIGQCVDPTGTYNHIVRVYDAMDRAYDISEFGWDIRMRLSRLVERGHKEGKLSAEHIATGSVVDINWEIVS